MTETIILSEKFTVTYKRRKPGEADSVYGFLRSDSDSGGYPAFSQEPDRTYLRNSVADAMKDADMIRREMTNYYGHDEIDFDTIQVIRYSVVIETIDDIEAAHQKSLVENGLAKLSGIEIAAIRDAVLADNGRV